MGSLAGRRFITATPRANAASSGPSAAKEWRLGRTRVAGGFGRRLQTPPWQDWPLAQHFRLQRRALGHDVCPSFLVRFFLAASIAKSAPCSRPASASKPPASAPTKERREAAAVKERARESKRSLDTGNLKDELPAAARRRQIWRSDAGMRTATGGRTRETAVRR
ncbi:MAG: hypothetical protein M3464_12015, partial [Chloroflexota bacterium]|nr:hypothetical protein [Chloroflexota bacterium]